MGAVAVKMGVERGALFSGCRRWRWTAERPEPAEEPALSSPAENKKSKTNKRHTKRLGIKHEPFHLFFVNRTKTTPKWF